MPVVFQEEPSPRAAASIKLPRNPFPEAEEPKPYRPGEGSPKNQVRVRQMSRPVSPPLDFNPEQAPDS